MLIEDLGEQKQIRAYLNKSIENDLLSQSYIFESSNDSEAYEVALDFAKAILTNDLSSDMDSLTEQFDTLNYPDLHIYEPEKNIIKRDKIDDLIKYAYRKSYYKGKKIFIIKDAEKMNLSAANTLLKTLEEPISEIVIILLVKNISLLLATITSRCQILKFKTEDLSKIYIADESNGRIEYFELFEKIARGNTLVIYELEKYFEKKKDNINQILDLFELYLRDIAYMKIDRASDIVNLDKKDEIRELSNEFSFDRISNVIDGLQQLKLDVVRNVNHKFITDSLVFIIQEES